MGILKWFGQALKMTFLDNDLAKEFKNQVSPPKDYQKEAAENLDKILKELRQQRKDMSK
ncbi:MAG: hypothetical protein J6J24_05315 [Clostridia bacterium]|nr:hypothetical protein [Clostridia bacterium]